MNKFLGTAGAVVLLALTSSPAQAVSPSTQATATARVYSPLTIAFGQNLDFGTVVLGSGTWSGEVVNLSSGNTLTCGGGTNLTCSGSHQVATYHIVGANNANVTITSPSFAMGSLTFTPNFTSTVNLGSSGRSTGVDISLGGQITLASTTAEGVYTGTFAVTADYQ
jgi:Mat/Ecp fimbriae major subunit